MQVGLKIFLQDGPMMKRSLVWCALIRNFFLPISKIRIPIQAQDQFQGVLHMVVTKSAT